MMDTLGAIVGPLSTALLLRLTHSHYTTVFAWTLVPGLLAAAVIAFLVPEKHRVPVPYVTFGKSLKALPPPFRKYLVAVGIFGVGNFAHTLLILLAARALTRSFAVPKAASYAVGLYALHNVLYAGLSFISGWLADRSDKRSLLAGGYFLAAIMACLIMFFPLTLSTLAAVFVLGGIYVAVEETLEDSLCAEMVHETQQGMAFGILATVNGIGDFTSSLVVGFLWTAYGTTVAFGYSAVLFVAGASLVVRLKPASHFNHEDL